ncbi:tyrosine-type recombinase/integrase [Paraburkholderia atlantica]|uniref:tyrosine-type recombinase/integrase n=1 Tax=Paraburkholderia atlantica TaxID=2654982 RepID=UPI003D237410
MGKLTEYKCAHAKAGRHGDGDGLYLQVRARDARSWVYRYRDGFGKDREMGLGKYPVVSLAEARDAALAASRLRAQGIDPLDNRRAQEVADAAVGLEKKTFRAVAAKLIDLKRPEWSNDKHAKQWESTLETYAYPHIGDLPVEVIDTHHTLACLQPIWLTKTETARRLQQRLALIMGYAVAHKLHPGPNPAVWKGGLDLLLTSHRRMKQANPDAVKHHAALPWSEMATFMQDLRAREAQSARMLEFTIYTCARTNNVVEAEWSEIDFDAAVWTIPGSKMKARKDHRVPLSRQALAVLEGQRGIDDRLVFAAAKDTALSNMAMLTLLERMKRDDLTVHGFRSSFRDWVSESTDLDPVVADPVAAEVALAHAVGDATERAYARGDMFAKRARQMQAWADYCSTPPKVTKLPRRRKAA